MLTVKPSKQLRTKSIPIRWTTSSVSNVDTKSRRSVHMRQEGLQLENTGEKVHKSQSKYVELKTVGT